MRVILGIGNPGKQYQLNRHNAGFLFLDYFANQYNLEFKPGKGDYYFAQSRLNGSDYLLVKPTTYVNNSGVAAKDVLLKENISTEDLLVLCDDVNIKLGAFRVRKSGGDGGHNGLSSIIYQLNTEDFPRIRIGVGNTDGNLTLSEFVLSDFTEEEISKLKQVFVDIKLLVDAFIYGGVNEMLNANSKLGIEKKSTDSLNSK